MSINSAIKCQDHPQIKILEYRSFPLKLRKIHRQHTKMLFQLIKVILRVVGQRGIYTEFRIPNEWFHSSRISGELIPSTSKSNTKNRHYRGGRIRSGPYEKYKDESGKIKVEEIADPIERERVLEKREKNRVAAEKARQKKRERIDELEREKKRLEELIAASDLDATRIQRNLDYLRVSFQEHEKVCCFKK